jgi:hypothetical protein
MDLYNDKARYDSFLNQQSNIESGFREEQENYSNQLQNAKLAARENKQIGSEMFFQSLPQALLEGQQVYSKVKGVYDKAQKVVGQAQDLKTKVQGFLENGGEASTMPIGTITSAPSREVEFSNPLFDADIPAPVKSNVKLNISTQLDNPSPELLGSIKDFLRSPIDADSSKSIVGSQLMTADPAVSGSSPLFESFGNVKNYLGGQVGDIGSRVSVLPNAETSIGSLKQAMPKIPAAEDVGDVVKSVGDAASDVVSDVAKKGLGLLEESSIPVVGDILAGVGLVTSVYEGVKSLFDKPEKAPPAPVVDVPTTAVMQAGV